MSQSFNNSQSLLRRADFNLFSQNMKINSQKINQIHGEMASRPRRKSVHEIADNEAFSSIFLEGTGNMKQHVVANLQKTVQLTSELQDLKL